MNPYEVLREPIASEKSVVLRDQQNMYTFRIDRRATKDDVSNALQRLYDIKPLKVRTMIVRGSIRRARNFRTVKEPNIKKAIVTIPEGKTLPIFEAQ